MKRRSFVAGGAASLTPTVGTSATPSPTPHADADLLAACAEFTRLELLARATLEGAHGFDEDDPADKAANRVWDLQDPHRDVMCTTPPRTREGALAVFRAAMLWLEEDPEDDPDGAHETRLRAAAHRAALVGLGA